MKVNKKIIILVDGEQGVLDKVESILKKERIRAIKKAVSGKEALAIMQTSEPDLIVLDVMLPDTDGVSLYNQIRQYTQAPVLFLTARASDPDKLKELGIGGDAFITKPYHPSEVAAWIKAHLCRQSITQEGAATASAVWDYGRLMINRDERRLVINGEDIHCTAKEFALLTFLCSHPNRIFSTPQLYENVWKSSYLSDDKTVVMHISKLRRKIEPDPKEPRIIVNIKGSGYKFVPPREIKKN